MMTAEESRRRTREEISRLPGFKQDELDFCLLCNETPLGKGLTFYRIQIERFGFNPDGLREVGGLAMQLGGGPGGLALARVMGSNPDIANRLSETDGGFIVCDRCAMDHRNGMVILRLMESFHERADRRAKEKAQASEGDDVDTDKETG